MDHGFVLDIANYRGVKSGDVRLTPGVWCLIGPNGAGKTTVIKAPRVLRYAYRKGLSDAFKLNGGLRSVMHLAALGSDVEISLHHLASDVTWQVMLPLPFDVPPRVAVEQVTLGKEIIVTRDQAGQISLRGEPIFTPTDERMALRAAFDTGRAPELTPFINWLDDYRVYGEYDERSALAGQASGDDDHLHPSGENLAVVLRNWHGGRPQIAKRFAFVRETLRTAFPDSFEDLHFAPGGDMVFLEWTPRIEDVDTQLPLSAASRGMRRALLHLAAVAGASLGGAIAIDDFEDALHPHAIRVLVDAIRAKAVKEKLIVLLATQSPVVLNTFQEFPENVIVCGGIGPLPLTKVRDPGRLAQFSLGDLYSVERIGAQTAGADK